MKKIALALSLGLLMAANLYAGGRFVRVEYKHDVRGPYKEMTIELGSERNSERDFYAKFFAKSYDQIEISIDEIVLSIEKEYFDTIYNRVLDLNFREIIKGSESIVGMDGNVISITAGVGMNYLETTMWSPDYLSEIRRTVDFASIIFDLLSLFGKEGWL
jgi:hypothetical protein